MHEPYTPLFLAISVPTLLVGIGLILNRSDFNSIRKELADVRERLASVDTRLGFIETLLGIPAKPAPAQKKG